LFNSDGYKVYNEDELLIEQNVKQTYGEVVLAKADLLGNIIIGTNSKEDDHIDHVLILDTTYHLHDYSSLADNYSERAPEGQGEKGIKDFYGENYFSAVVIDRYEKNTDSSTISEFGNFSLGSRYIGQSKQGFDDETIMQRALYGANKSSLNEINVHSGDHDIHYFEKELFDFYLVSEKLVLLGFMDAETRKGEIRLYDSEQRTVIRAMSGMDAVRSVYYDSVTGHYWIGSRSGLLVLDENWNHVADFSKNFEEISDGTVKQVAISHDDISTIIRQDDVIWAGSLGGGVYKIDPISYKILNSIQAKLTMA